MLATVSKRKPGPKPSADKPARGPVLYVRMPDELEAAMQAFIQAQIIQPDRTAVAVKAIEELLSRHGHWPPKPAR